MSSYSHAHSPGFLAERRPAHNLEGATPVTAVTRFRADGAFSFLQALSANDTNARGLRALLTLNSLELDASAFGQALEAFALDACVVDEQVLSAVFRRNEPVSLVVVEPLDGSGCHLLSSLPFREQARNARKRIPVLVLRSPSRLPRRDLLCSTIFNQGDRAPRS